MKKKKEDKIYKYLTLITFVLVLACFIKMFFLNNYKDYVNDKFFATNVDLRKSKLENNYYDGILFELKHEGFHDYSNNGLSIYFKCYNSNGLLTNDDIVVYMNGYTPKTVEYKILKKLPLSTSYCELNGVEVWNKLIENYNEEDYILK